MLKKLFKDKFNIGLVLVLLLSVILRFYNYQNRWGLAYDQARDTIVSLFAINSHQVPLLGPFSSAGQFVYGPQWFWIIMLFQSFSKNFLILPWILQSILYVFVVYLAFLIGKHVEDKKLGLIFALFTCFSVGQIGQSVNLSSPSMVGVFSFVTFYFFVRYIKYYKKSDLFLTGFFLGNAVNIHFQAVGLTVLLPISIILGKRKLKDIVVLLLGFTLPFIPLIFFDLRSHFFESRNMLDYYLHGQYRIYVPNRWLTYVGVFWPNAWARVIGGKYIVGAGTIGLFTAIACISIYKRKITKSFLASIIVFLAIFIWLRNYRGPRYDSYLVFLHPLILLFSSWTAYSIYKINKILGALFIIVLIGFSLNLTFLEIKNASNLTSLEAIRVREVLQSKFPGQKFAVYDYEYKNVSYSLPLVLYLYVVNKIDDKGRKIGFTVTNEENASDTGIFLLLYGGKGWYQLVDLSSSSSADLSKHKWNFVNPSQIYKATENWYK